MEKCFIYFFLIAAYFSQACFGNKINANTLQKKYPCRIYQDVIVQDKVLIKGENECSARYDIIKPIFEHFQGPFSILDIGAAQGYFSFRIAYDFPHAHCTLIDENSSDYHYQGDFLRDLCFLNRLDNITYLQKRITYYDLCLLNRLEHFDVVLAFLVIHQMGKKPSDHQMIFERLLSLGDHVIIEVADNAAIGFTHFIESLAKNSDCEFLGEVLRSQNRFFPVKGRFYWFKGSKTTNRHKISKNTFQLLNGVYPHAFMD